MQDKVISRYIHELAGVAGHKEAIIFKNDFRSFRYTYKDLYQYACQVANLLDTQGINKGDKIIIWHYNSPEWGALLLACAMTGVIAVPVDFNASHDFVQKIKEQTKVKRIFASFIKKVDSVEVEVMENLFDTVKDQSLSYNANTSITEDDTFEIIYTSGTTSEPKGVVITNKNIVSNIRSLRIGMKQPKNSVFLSTIPMSHLLEQTLGFFVPLRFGGKIVYTSSRKSSVIKRAIQEEGVTAIVTVPAFLKVLKDKIEREADEKGQSQKLMSLRQLPAFIKNPILRKKVSLLKSLRFLIVGGAALTNEVEQFWNDMGVIVLQGYGLTETAPMMTYNTIEERRFGTVGRPLPNQEVYIEKDGEILCKGDNVFTEYYQNPEATHKAFSNGWFHTGDLGELDDDGFLRIKGRKKNMILTDAGLNVYPEDIENHLAKFDQIKYACVLGLSQNDKTVITAVIIANQQDNDLLHKLNRDLPSHQKIQQLIYWPKQDFPRTPSLKVKRREIVKELKPTNESSATPAVSKDELINHIAKLADINPASIEESSNLYSDLQIDSLRRVELLSIIEEVFGVEIEENRINEETTIQKLRELIKTHSSSKSKDFSYWSFSPMITPIRSFIQSIAFWKLEKTYSVEVEGLNHLKGLGKPVIYALNHTSHLDSPTFLKALPKEMRKKVAMAGAEDYFFEIQDGEEPLKKKLMILLLRLGMNAYPFSRTSSIRNSFKRTGKILDKGFSIGIFPEGTRTMSGKMSPFKTGIALLATQMDTLIVPVKLEGLYDILPKGANKLKPGKAKVTFGKPYKARKDASLIDTAKEIENLVKSL